MTRGWAIDQGLIFSVADSLPWAFHLMSKYTSSTLSGVNFLYGPSRCISRPPNEAYILLYQN